MSDNSAVKEDFLDEDPEISSQRYVLLSFISPENVLQRKDLFMFERFLEDYEVQVRTKGLESFIANFVQTANDDITKRADELEASGNSDVADLLRKKRLRIDDYMSNFQDYVAKNQREINQTKILDAYKDFISRKQVELEDRFFSENKFHTTMRGLKVRGSYATPAEAEARAKKLQRTDQLHNILIGEVGKWLPWDPNPSQIDKQEYAEDQLNELMKKYKENEDARDQYYKEQKKQRPVKQVISGEESAADATMFSEVGDLALQRKMDAALNSMK